MAKEKTFEQDSEAHEPEKARRAIRQPLDTAIRRRFRYIGPDYQRGIRLPSGQFIRPLEMSDEAIETILPAAPHLFEEI